MCTVSGCRPMDDGKPKFSKTSDATDIVKVLVPRIYPTDKVSQYNSGVKSMNRLMTMADWEAELKQFRINHAKARIASAPKLF